MKNLDRSKASVSATQAHYHNQGRRQEELESYRKQSDDLWNQLQEADREIEQQKQAAALAKQEAKKTAALASKRKRENENLFQRLMGAIQSRNSMRGRLGNMTMQRNRAMQQAESLAEQNRVVMQELKEVTDRLGASFQQMNQLQADYAEDMTELAQAYQTMPLDQRASLPPSLKQLLDQLEQDFTGVGQ